MTRRLTTSMAAVAVAVAVAVAIAGGSAHAGSLENLERERAIMLHSLLSADLTPVERHNKVNLSRARLIDLERIVLRDKDLVGKNTPAVRSAFDNYDLTFLMHASIEHNHAVLDHWMQQLGLSTQSLMTARPGRR